MTIMKRFENEGKLVDGVLFDSNGTRVHDWLVTENEDGTGKILFVPKGQRHKFMKQKSKRIKAKKPVKTVDVGVLLERFDYPIKLAFANVVCYTLDKKEGI